MNCRCFILIFTMSTLIAGMFACSKDENPAVGEKSSVSQVESVPSEESHKIHFVEKGKKISLQAKPDQPEEVNQCQEFVNHFNPGRPPLISEEWAHNDELLELPETGPYYELFDAIDLAAGSGSINKQTVNLLKTAYSSSTTGPHPFEFGPIEELASHDVWQFLSSENIDEADITKHSLVKGPLNYFLKEKGEGDKHIFLVSGDLNLSTVSRLNKLKDCLIVSTGNVKIHGPLLKCSVIAKGSVKAGNVEGGLLMAKEEIHANPIAYDTIGWRPAGQVLWQVYPPTIASKFVKIDWHTRGNRDLPEGSPAMIFKFVDVFREGGLKNIPESSSHEWLNFLRAYGDSDFIIEGDRFCVTSDFYNRKAKLNICPSLKDKKWGLNYYVEFGDGSKASLDGFTGESRHYNSDGKIIGLSDASEYLHLMVYDYNRRRQNAFKKSYDSYRFKDKVDPWVSIFPKISKLQKSLCPIVFSMDGSEFTFSCETGTGENDVTIDWKSPDDYEAIFIIWNTLLRNNQITSCKNVNNLAFQILALSGEGSELIHGRLNPKRPWAKRQFVKEAEELKVKVDADLRKNYHLWGIDSYPGFEDIKMALSQSVVYHLYLKKLADAGVIRNFDLNAKVLGRYIHLPMLKKHASLIQTLTFMSTYNIFQLLDPKVAPYFSTYFQDIGILNQKQGEELLKLADEAAHSGLSDAEVEAYFTELVLRYGELKESDYAPLLFIYRHHEFLKKESERGGLTIDRKALDNKHVRTTIKLDHYDAFYYWGHIKDKAKGAEILETQLKTLGISGKKGSVP